MGMAMTFLLDTNVNLDALLKRYPWCIEAEAIVQAHLEGKVHAHITASTITDIYYILTKQISNDAALEIVRLILQDFNICSVDKDDLYKAAAFPGGDFEDNLQAVCAAKANVDFIVTRDKRGFVYSSVPVLSPSEFLEQLKVL